MGHRWLLVLIVALALPALAQSPKPEPDPNQFKLVVRYYDAWPDPIGVGEIVSWRGRIYQFSSESKEFVVIDFANGEVELIDLSRKLQARIPLAKLEDKVASQKKRLLKTAAELEKREDRASRVAAKKTRDLVEPTFRAQFDAAANRLRLQNESVEITADGIADTDAPRLTLIAEAMDTFVKLAAARDSTDIPPFTRLEVHSTLIREKKLRPAEISILYRLNGPPSKKRWTYRLEPQLKDRDFIGLAKLDHYREQCKRVVMSEYEKPEEP
jgi:hypothetical protein